MSSPPNGSVPSGNKNSPSPRWLSSASYFPGVGTILFGGKTTANINNGILGDSWLFDSTGWSTLVVPTNPTPRYDSSMGYDGAGITLTCGCDSQSNLSDTWFYTGTNWQLISAGIGKVNYQNAAGLISSNPSRLKGSELVYLSGSIKNYLTGGVGFIGHYISDVWQWQKSNNAWSQLTGVPNSFSGRAYHAAAASSTKMVVFGGKGQSSILSDTWTFDGSVWSLIPGNGPGRRYGHQMVFDTSTNLFVLHGGINDTTYLGDTYTFNPATSSWAYVTNGGPTRRAYASMVFDSNINRTVLFGGLGETNAYDDTWLFNSSTGTWVQA